MFNSEDPANVAAQIRGNFHAPPEKMLLAHAGVQNTDPTIRAQLQSDEKNMQGAGFQLHRPHPGQSRPGRAADQGRHHRQERRRLV